MIRIALTPEETSQLATTRCSRRAQVAERCRYVLLNVMWLYSAGHTETRTIRSLRGVFDRTSRTQSHKPLNLLVIFFLGHTALKNN